MKISFHFFLLRYFTQPLIIGNSLKKTGCEDEVWEPSIYNHVQISLLKHQGSIFLPGADSKSGKVSTLPYTPVVEFNVCYINS